MYKTVEVEVEIDKEEVIDFLESCSAREYIAILMEVKRGKGRASSRQTVEEEIVTENLLELAEKVTLDDLDRIEGCCKV